MSCGRCRLVVELRKHSILPNIGQWWRRRGRLLANGDWGPGFNFPHRLKIFHNISVFTPMFSFSLCDTHLGRWAFLSFCLSCTTVSCQHLSFFTSSSLLFLCEQVVPSKQMFFSLSLFSIYLTLFEPSINTKLLLCGLVEQAKKTWLI